jgi:hypothetical protein
VILYLELLSMILLQVNALLILKWDGSALAVGATMVLYQGSILFSVLGVLGYLV